MSDYVAVMNHGRFEQVDTPSNLYRNPQTPFVAGFVGDNNTWKGTIVSRDDRFARLRTEDGGECTTAVPEPMTTGQAVTLFLRPEAMLILPDPTMVGLNRFQVVVKAILFDGANSRLLVHPLGADTELLVALPQNRQYDHLRVDDTIEIGWYPQSGICFPRTAEEANDEA